MERLEIMDLADSGLEREWDAYVSAHPGRSQYHSIAWKEILAESFGHKALYLAALASGRIRGILPLFEISSWLLGHRLVSLPFVNYGGVLADDPVAEATLTAHAVGLARRTGAASLLLRQSAPLMSRSKPNLRVRGHKAALVLHLSADPTRHWQGLSSRLRGKIRKAEKSGAVFARVREDGLEDFHRVFGKNMRDLGTPVHAVDFFATVLRRCPKAEILLVKIAGRPAAAALSLRDGDLMELPWICSDYDFGSIYANEYLYWKAIETACSEKATSLDFGRSSIGAGTYAFKMQWSPEPHPLHWYHWTATENAAPDLSPESPALALAARCWKRLPVPVANRIGPHLIRHLP